MIVATAAPYQQNDPLDAWEPVSHVNGDDSGYGQQQRIRLISPPRDGIALERKHMLAKRLHIKHDDQFEGKVHDPSWVGLDADSKSQSNIPSTHTSWAMIRISY